MTRRLTSIALVLAAAVLAARAATPPAFDDDFLDKALRFDLYQVGDAKEETVTLDQIYLEALWPESRTHLIDPFNYGHYVVKLYDVASNRLIYSRGFDSTFAEYKTTTPALNGTKRVFERSVRVPYPKRPFLFVIEARDKNNLLHPLFTQAIDPADYHIIRETTAAGDFVYEARRTGDPHDKVDLVFLAEGYTAEDKDKFKADVDRISAFLFTVEPYKSAKDRFNIRGVFRPSPERAMDEPRQSVYRKTVLDASFNAFDLDRYMLIEEDHRMHEIAAQVPYDAIIVLVNSKRYGGGSIAFDYCVTTVDNAEPAGLRPRARPFLRRPGRRVLHVGGLLQRLLSQGRRAARAQHHRPPRPGQRQVEGPPLARHRRPDRVRQGGAGGPRGRAAEEPGGAGRAVDEASKKGEPEAKIKAIEAKYEAADKALPRSRRRGQAYAGLEDKVGVFEGAGYAAKGLYRPQIDCIMISSPRGVLRVCQRAIGWMIDYFCEGK